MTLVIDTVNGRGLSNEACHELLPKKTKLRNAVLTIRLSLKAVLLAV